LESEADPLIELRQALINFKSWVYQHKASGGLSNQENQEWAFRCLWDVEALVRGGWHSNAARQAASNLAKLERMLGVGFAKTHRSERRMALGLDNESLGVGSRGPLAKKFDDPFKAMPTTLSSLQRAGPNIECNPAGDADVPATLPRTEPAEAMRELLRVASELLHETVRLRSEVGELNERIISTQDTNTRHPYASAPAPQERSQGLDAMNMIDQARVAMLNCEYELSAIKARINTTGENFEKEEAVAIAVQKLRMRPRNAVG
jgi:hypothetical protein